jgi:hypothetical protein
MTWKKIRKHPGKNPGRKPEKSARPERRGRKPGTSASFRSNACFLGKTDDKFLFLVTLSARLYPLARQKTKGGVSFAQI